MPWAIHSSLQQSILEKQVPFQMIEKVFAGLMMDLLIMAGLQ
jgi:hypothetical protein